MNCKNTCWMAGLVGAGIVIGAMGMGVVTTQPEGEMDMDAMMEQWMQANQPGPQHKTLASMVGEWNFVMKDLRSGDEFQGQQSDEMALNGRYLLSHVETEFAGMPFEGMGAMAYDNIAKKYVSVWIDNMSTGIFVHEGNASADGKTITLKGEMEMPGMGKMASKHVYHLSGPDSMKLEFYEGPAGSELPKTGEITYTRK